MVTSFTINVRVKGQEFFKRMASRLRDFAQPFEEIIQSWQKHEVDKFAQARGKELTGTSFDDGAVQWDPVTPEYHAWKQKKGFADWRMVLTGDTMASLVDRKNPDWFERIEPDYAIFGSVHPLVLLHWHRSPVVFLDAEDRAGIQREVFDYLSGHPPYAPYPKVQAQHSTTVPLTDWGEA